MFYVLNYVTLKNTFKVFLLLMNIFTGSLELDNVYFKALW